MTEKTNGQANTAVNEQTASQNQTLVKMMQESTVNKVMGKINEMQEHGEKTLHPRYNPGSALKRAWLYLQTIETKDKKKAIDACTKDSICNCLLEMTLRGQTPKEHCYFIPCGNSLEYWEKYTGKYMRAKRDTDIKSINPQVIYEGDNFVYTVDEQGQYQLVSHDTQLQNIDISKIKAGYAVVIRKDGTRYLEIMTMEQVKKAWQQGAAKGNSGAHINFTDQMVKKTLIARASKVALESATGEEESDTMTPPDHAEETRDEAQQLPASENIEDASYEEVPNGTKRECPI
jgi:recombination protein RecT